MKSGYHHLVRALLRMEAEVCYDMGNGMEKGWNHHLKLGMPPPDQRFWMFVYGRRPIRAIELKFFVLVYREESDNMETLVGLYQIFRTGLELPF